MKIESTAPAPVPFERKPDAKEAASQFEALIIGQLLENSGVSWTDEESGGAILDYAQQSMASALAASGGLGLASLLGPLSETGSNRE